MRKFIRESENNQLDFLPNDLSNTGGCENIHSKHSEEDPSERGPPNSFVLEDEATANFQNTVFQLQWNSLKTSLIKKFSCQVCQDKEAPKFSHMINIHISLLEKHKKCMEKLLFHCVVYFLYQNHKQFSHVSIHSFHSIERMLSVHMGSSLRSFPYVRVTQQMTRTAVSSHCACITFPSPLLLQPSLCFWPRCC